MIVNRHDHHTVKKNDLAFQILTPKLVKPVFDRLSGVHTVLCQVGGTPRTRGNLGLKFL